MFNPDFYYFLLQIDCDSLFAIDLVEMPSAINPPNWNQTDTIYQEYLLHGGQVDTKEWFLNNADMGGGKMVPTNFSKTLVENYSERN